MRRYVKSKPTALMSRVCSCLMHSVLRSISDLLYHHPGQDEALLKTKKKRLVSSQGVSGECYTFSLAWTYGLLLPLLSFGSFIAALKLSRSTWNLSPLTFSLQNLAKFYAVKMWNLPRSFWQIMIHDMSETMMYGTHNQRRRRRENPVTDEETALGEQRKSFGDLLNSDKIPGSVFGRCDDIISLPWVIMSQYRFLCLLRISLSLITQTECFILLFPNHLVRRAKISG